MQHQSSDWTSERASKDVNTCMTTFFASIRLCARGRACLRRDRACYNLSHSLICSRARHRQRLKSTGQFGAGKRYSRASRSSFSWGRRGVSARRCMVLSACNYALNLNETELSFSIKQWTEARFPCTRDAFQVQRCTDRTYGIGAGDRELSFLMGEECFPALRTRLCLYTPCLPKAGSTVEPWLRPCSW